MAPRRTGTAGSVGAAVVSAVVSTVVSAAGAAVVSAVVAVPEVLPQPASRPTVSASRQRMEVIFFMVSPSFTGTEENASPPHLDIINGLYYTYPAEFRCIRNA